MSISLDDVMTRCPGAQTFMFGDNPVPSAELPDPVRSGQKTAIRDALGNDPEGSPDMPAPGRRDIALTGMGRRCWSSKPSRFRSSGIAM